MTAGQTLSIVVPIYNEAENLVHPGAADDRSQCPGHDARSRAVEADMLRRRP